MKQGPIFWLAQKVRSRIPAILLLTASNMGHALFGVFFALGSRGVIDSAVSGDFDRFLRACGNQAAIILGILVCYGMVRHMTDRLRADLERDWKRSLLHGLLHGEYAAVKEYHSAELLNRLNVILGEDDHISVGMDEQTYDGMEIVIDRVTYATETYSRTLPYSTEYVASPDLPEGEEQIVTAGCDGEELCTAMVTYENGQEINRNVTRTRTVVEPVNQVIAVGTAMAKEAVSGELTIGDGVIITPEGDMLTYTGCVNVLATAYTCEATGGYGITATGTRARVGAIAVDPFVIPYGTRMFIVSADGEYIYGIATAEDCGHPDYITGYRVDLYMDTEAECVRFGARDCQVYILG